MQTEDPTPINPDVLNEQVRSVKQRVTDFGVLMTVVVGLLTAVATVTVTNLFSQLERLSTSSAAMTAEFAVMRAHMEVLLGSAQRIEGGISDLQGRASVDGNFDPISTQLSSLPFGEFDWVVVSPGQEIFDAVEAAAGDGVVNYQGFSDSVATFALEGAAHEVRIGQFGDVTLNQIGVDFTPEPRADLLRVLAYPSGSIGTSP